MLAFAHKVAPHVGAWIETSSTEPENEDINVAPHVGAWIETFVNKDILGPKFVAPHVGAWIETKVMRYGTQEQESRTSCRCVD